MYNFTVWALVIYRKQFQLHISETRDSCPMEVELQMYFTTKITTKVVVAGARIEPIIPVFLLLA